MNYKKEYLEKINRLWKKNYADLNFMEVFINLPRISKKEIKDMTNDEILESMEKLSKKIDRKTDTLKSSKKLLDTIEKLWKEEEPFGEFINKICEKKNTDLSGSGDETLIKHLKNIEKEEKNEAN